MIDIGLFEITFRYNRSPFVVISADKKFVLKQKFKGNGVHTVTIPNKTQTTKFYLLEKTKNDTILLDNKIIDDQTIEIISAKHQGIVFDSVNFNHYFQPSLHHANDLIRSNCLGLNFPSYLTFENIALYDHLILDTLS